MTLVEEPMELLHDNAEINGSGGGGIKTSSQHVNNNGVNSMNTADLDIDQDINLDEYKPSHYGKNRGNRRIQMDESDEELDEGTLKSLEKYRPSHYDSQYSKTK